MSLFLLVAGSDFYSVNPSDTDPLPCLGHLNASITGGENGIEILARNAFTLSGMFVRAEFNNITAASTFFVRDNGANGNQTVTIPASTEGDFEDTTNTDSISSGQTFNYQANGGATGTSLSIFITSMTLDDPDGNVHLVCSASNHTNQDRNQTRHYPIGSEVDHESGNGESQTQYRLRFATTYSDFRFTTNQNGITDASTARMRIDGADGNQVITIAASTSGAFEDTTNTDVVPANSLINWELVTGMGAHSDAQMRPEQFCMHGDGLEQIIANGRGNGSTFPINVTRFRSLSADGSFGSPTEVFVAAKLQYAADFQNLFVRAITNSANGVAVFTFRDDVADTAITVSVTASTTGEFEDTTNAVSVGAGSKIVLGCVSTASSSGAHLFGQSGIQITETPSVVEDAEIIGSRHMPQLHPRAATRAAPYSYWRDNLLAVEEQVFPPIRPMDQLHPRAAQRAAPNDYWIDNLLAVEEQVFPPIRPMAQLHPRAAPRAAPYSYWHDNLLAVEEVAELPPIRPMVQLLPRAALRGSPLLYWIDNFLAIDEPDNLIRPMVQLLPRAALRAAPYSYWRDNLLAIDEPDNLIRPMVQLLPRAALRPSPLSLWIDNLLAIEEPPALIRPMPQLLPRAALRGSPLLYWIDNLLAAEEFPPVRPMDQLHPRAAPRGAPLSYWIDNQLAVEEILPPPIRPMDQLHPRAALRGSPLSYWIDNLLAVAEISAVIVELSYVIDAVIGSPAIGFQQKQMIVKQMILKELQIKGLIGPS